MMDIENGLEGPPYRPLYNEGEKNKQTGGKKRKKKRELGGKEREEKRGRHMQVREENVVLTPTIIPTVVITGEGPLEEEPKYNLYPNPLVLPPSSFMDYPSNPPQSENSATAPTIHSMPARTTTTTSTNEPQPWFVPRENVVATGEQNRRPFRNGSFSEKTFRTGEGDVLPACLLFGFGFLCCLPWICGTFYLRSRNSVARFAGWASFTMIIIALIGVALTGLIILSSP